jgi:putative transposase
MVKTEMYPIEKKMTMDELNNRIKKVEKDVKVLNRLYFIKNRYLGDPVEIASSKVGVTKRVGYIWQERWNKDGYDGLIPRFGGGRSSKLGEDQKNELIELLKERDNWTTNEVRELIKERFDVSYTLKQVRVILRSFGFRYGKPYPHDYRRPKNAEGILKKGWMSR